MRRYLVEYLYWFKIKKIDKEAKTDNINKTVFWIIICYDIFYFSQTSTAAYALMMLSILLPLAIITLSVSKHPAKLTQLEYLCPLSYEERKTKIKNAIIDQYIAIRKAKGLSQEKIANLTGIARTNIVRIEAKRNMPSIDILTKLANAVDMELEVKLVEKKQGTI